MASIVVPNLFAGMPKPHISGIKNNLGKLRRDIKRDANTADVNLGKNAILKWIMRAMDDRKPIFPDDGHEVLFRRFYEALCRFADILHTSDTAAKPYIYFKLDGGLTIIVSFSYNAEIGRAMNIISFAYQQRVRALSRIGIVCGDDFIQWINNAIGVSVAVGTDIIRAVQHLNA